MLICLSLEMTLNVVSRSILWFSFFYVFHLLTRESSRVSYLVSFGLWLVWVVASDDLCLWYHATLFLRKCKSICCDLRWRKKIIDSFSIMFSSSDVLDPWTRWTRINLLQVCLGNIHILWTSLVKKLSKCLVQERLKLTKHVQENPETNLLNIIDEWYLCWNVGEFCGMMFF